MRAAIVHYWLLGMRGGEKVLEALCRLLPDADIFTLFYDPLKVSEEIRRHRVKASFLNPLRRHYRTLLPLMPLALEHFDLREYDLVVSSESGPAKGVLAPASARHVCYCHTPMRYLWDLYPDYANEWVRSRRKRAVMAPVASLLRVWDHATAARVDQFIANSENVRRRIRRAWDREAAVVHPPVDIHRFHSGHAGDYYLVVSELVPYKRIDLAVEAFTQSGRQLRIVGDGPEYRSLRKQAGPNVAFCGRVTDADVVEQYAQCRALILPGEEDFGITAVEALASGKPVVALNRGGVIESLPPAPLFGGVLFDRPEADHLNRAVEQLEASYGEVRPDDLRRHSLQFSEAEFARKMRPFLGLS